MYRLHYGLLEPTEANRLIPYHLRKSGFDQTRLLAGRLAAEIDRGTCACYATDADLTYNGAFVVLAFEQILGRSPSMDEQTECEHYLDEQTDQMKAGLSMQTSARGSLNGVNSTTEPAQRARERLVYVLCHSEEFLQRR